MYLKNNLMHLNVISIVAYFYQSKFISKFYIK